MARRIVGLLLIIAGLLFCLVPLSAHEYQALSGQRRLQAYLNDLERADPADLAAERRQAEEFNESFEQTGEGTRDPFDTEVDFGPSDVKPLSDVYGYLVIPSIDVNLPLYLGATNEHLSRGVAQVDGTSLPVGGIGSRSVIAGHNGGYSNHYLLFIDRLQPGDRIYVVAQGALLVYEVYDSEVILPTEWEKLAAVDGQDTLTLLTCTPIPVNSHRLLVDARRVLPASPAESVGDNTEQLRADLAEARAVPAAPGTAAWRWATRIAIVVLTVGLLWTLVRLARAVREVRSPEAVTDAPADGPAEQDSAR